MNTLQKLEASRKQQPPRELNFPAGTTHTDYEVYGTLAGSMVSKCKDLTMDFFTDLQYIKSSRHPIKNEEFHHFHAYSTNTKQYVTIIAKRI